MDINYDKLAIGLLEVMDQRGELGIMSVGMIPKNTFEWFIGLMFEEIAKKLTVPGAKYEWSDADTIAKSFTKEFKSEIEKEMSLALYRNAKMVV